MFVNHKYKWALTPIINLNGGIKRVVILQIGIEFSVLTEVNAWDPSGSKTGLQW